MDCDKIRVKDNQKAVRWMSGKYRLDKDSVKVNLSKNKRKVLREVIASLKFSQETILRKTAEYKKCLRRATREDFIYDGSFHEAIRPVLTIAHVFGVMPLKGINAKDAQGLSFSWSSPGTVYSLIAGISLVIYLVLTLNFTFKNRFRLDDTDPIIFYGSIATVYITFIKLATKWPRLMLKWHEIEKNLPEYQSQLDRAVLANKIKIITLVILMMSLIEHILSMITMIHYANYCNPGKDPVEMVLRSQLSQMFFATEYSTWKALFGKTLNIIATFVWNYMDLFVMVVSCGLANKFHQVNASLFRSKGKPTSEAFWSEHRRHYRNLCNLCEEIDDAISFITMTSFSNNIYFICVQLLRSLNEMPSFAHAVYFWYALAFLIGRTLAVSLYSAGINDESKRPVQVFRRVPKDSWCLEVKRFSEEVTSDFVALSGMKFFHLTRNLVLSVAGTIVTYELVLIQFHVQETNTGC